MAQIFPFYTVTDSATGDHVVRVIPPGVIHTVYPLVEKREQLPPYSIARGAVAIGAVRFDQLRK